ncbi:hypothetical protein ACLOJK_024535 [Asimina triloba]
MLRVHVSHGKTVHTCEFLKPQVTPRDGDAKGQKKEKYHACPSLRPYVVPSTCRVSSSPPSLLVRALGREAPDRHGASPIFSIPRFLPPPSCCGSVFTDRVHLVGYVARPCTSISVRRVPDLQHPDTFISDIRRFPDLQLPVPLLRRRHYRWKSLFPDLLRLLRSVARSSTPSLSRLSLIIFVPNRSSSLSSWISLFLPNDKHNSANDNTGQRLLMSGLRGDLLLECERDLLVGVEHANGMVVGLWAMALGVDG